MTKEEILHLARLSRINLTDTEVNAFATEINAVLDYVSKIDDLVTDAPLTKTVGPVFNVFREDMVTNEPGSCTEALLATLPERQGNYLSVPKILKNNQDS